MILVAEIQVVDWLIVKIIYYFSRAGSSCSIVQSVNCAGMPTQPACHAALVTPMFISTALDTSRWVCCGIAHVQDIALLHWKVRVCGNARWAWLGFISCAFAERWLCAAMHIAPDTARLQWKMGVFGNAHNTCLGLILTACAGGGCVRQCTLRMPRFDIARLRWKVGVCGNAHCAGLGLMTHKLCLRWNG